MSGRTLLSYCDNALHNSTALLYDVELYLQQGRLSYKRFVVMKVIKVIKTLTSPMCLLFQWKHLQYNHSVRKVYNNSE